MKNKFRWTNKGRGGTVSEENWYIEAAKACEATSDALLRQPVGHSSKAVRILVGKLGAAGSSVGIFAMASLIGVASTGTAIGTLSGAAFTSAALAWVGGSVFMGSIVLAVASVLGGVLASLWAGLLFKKFLTGKRRKRENLNDRDRKLVDACLSLAVAFRQQHKANRPIDSNSSKFLYEDALKPLCEDLSDAEWDPFRNPRDWPILAKRRLEKAIGNLKSLSNWLRLWTIKHPNVAVGISTAVIIQLLSEDLPEFEGKEQLVIEAIKRSTNELGHDATIEDVSEYIKSKSPSEILGIKNNIKGIYHELSFAERENSDGDEYIAELFESTNHPGADVRITNILTGETTEIQLRATNYLSYVEKHNAKHPEITALVTEEVAAESSDFESSGLSNNKITDEVKGVFDDLDGAVQYGVATSMTVAAMVTLARNINVLLRGKKMTKAQKEKLIKDGVLAAGVAGIVSLFI